MQRKFNQAVFMDKQGKKQQPTGKGHQRDMNKVTNLFKKAGERVIPFYLYEFAGGPSLWI